MTSRPADQRVTLYVIHHSHTDVGYTAPQHRVERWHADFIRQALAVLANSRSEPDEFFTGFKWVNETFWSVERFLDLATNSEIAAFDNAVRSGAIGISASYLNLNELLDFDVLSRMIGRAQAYGRSIGHDIDSAMTADINGYSWGFARALLMNGVRNLFTCIHTHHGMYPLGRQQTAFWWETPGGDRLLVWSGEHYHFGNELGIVPGAVSSYLTKDDCDARMIFTDYWGVAERRIPRYFERLRNEGYQYDFAPVMVSGLRSDNAPPSPRIVDFVRRWNRIHGDEYRIEMATLTDFFRVVRERTADLPVYRGDWPDWWSDGPAGNPDSTRMFREAQRDLAYYRRLVERYRDVRPVPLDEIEYDLALYSEHTFSHAASMSRPWDLGVHAISSRKKAYAASAYQAVRDATEQALETLGAATLSPGGPLDFKVINPLDRDVAGMARLFVGHYEYNERGMAEGADVLDVDAGVTLPAQEEPALLGSNFCVHVELAPGEERTLGLQPAAQGTCESKPSAGGDRAGSPPCETAVASAVTETGLETRHVRIGWEKGEGIVSWHDTIRDLNLLRADRKHAAFTPIHELTPVAAKDKICGVRGEMRLNRKGKDVVRTAGRLIEARAVAAGPVFASVELDYELTGTGFLTVALSAHANQPVVDVEVRMHKLSAWEPENVYLSLPFAPGAAPYELWLDKAGALVRPRRDQIPGTLTDFYSVQEGLAVCGPEYGVAVGTPDSHLIQLGPLEHGTRLLMGDPGLDEDEAHIYAWMMTNYWETNFSADLGGFHEFRYRVTWGPNLGDPASALGRLRDMNHGILAFRTRPQ